MLNMLATWLEQERQWPQWAYASCLGLLLALVAMHVLGRALLSKKRQPLSSTPSTTEKRKCDSDAAFQRFRRQYLVVYFLVMFADWLQGTHMYSLYQGYRVNVSALFLTGFLSSALFGNFIGPIVDRYGRRNACLVYCALEITINLLENVPDMTVLLVGRVLGGVSTSLLFSAFESWMVTEHRARGFAEELIPKTFAIASEGNGVLAVLAGFAAQAAADAFGEIGPFRLAVGVTTLAAAFVCSWTENYGSPDANSAPASNAKSKPKSGSRLSGEAIALGLCYSLFDGAMYVFGTSLLHGIQHIASSCSHPNSWYFCSVLVVPDTGSRGALGDPSERTGVFEFYAVHRNRRQAVRSNWQQSARRAARLRTVRRLCRGAARSNRYGLFSVDPRRILRVRGQSTVVLDVWDTGEKLTVLAIGAFTPCCGTLRSRYFPSEGLSTTLGLFRLPTNLLVVLGTGGANHVTSDQLFRGCAAVLLVSTLCGVKLLLSSSNKLAPNASKKRN